MPFRKGDPLARVAGSKGIRHRWARATPDQRADAARVMNEARTRLYAERAAADASASGRELNPRQLSLAAHALWQADLADRRYLAWQARRAKAALATPKPSNQ